MRRLIISALILSGNLPIFADGPADNNPTTVRRVPPPGIEVPEVERMELEAGLATLQGEIRALRRQLKVQPHRLSLLPDIEIFSKAVAYALRYREFQKPNEFKIARAHLERGRARARQLAAGETPWLTQTGLVVRGFRSQIDGSVQPYGLVIPESYSFEGARKHRLDFWFHGRGERTVELGFLHQRLTNRGPFAPADTIVLHPFARYSNGNKFAGEIDCLEALEHAKQFYRIDPERILVRGFSMGGAACWNFAVHYADRWCAANPGAGYSETPEFLRTFQGETLTPTWYQRKLWHMHDCTDWAVNLAQLPTVAYSGEIDRQKQAADIMAVAMKKEGLTLRHIIGSKTAHKIHPDSKIEIEERLDAIAARGRDTVPTTVRFTTWTLRYNRMHWITVDQLAEHWSRARIEAHIEGASRVVVETAENIKAFTLHMPAGSCPLAPTVPPLLVIEKSVLQAPPVFSDRSWTAHCRKEKGGWVVSSEPAPGKGLVKRHRLQGPIDDAFLDSFVMVTPTGEAWHKAVGDWCDAELKHATAQWRQQFRGDARVKTDAEISEQDIAKHNLVLWGDPGSNRLLKSIAAELPIKWTRDTITVGAQTFPSESHALILIFPNPRNPERYVVLNSGFTYREYDYLNNARQVSKLPDWAVVDLTSPPTTQVPGAIPAAGFFTESWGLAPPSR